MNRALPDAELDEFVDALATRIASFDKWAIANTKRLVNSQPAARRRNRGGLGRLHGLGRAAGDTGEDQGLLRAGLPEARRGRRSTRVLPGPARPLTRAAHLSKDRHHGLARSRKDDRRPRRGGSVARRVPVAVCVIDTHGNVILTHRMSGAPAFSLELSERKAYTSALVGMRTADLLPARAARPGPLPADDGRWRPLLRDGRRGAAHSEGELIAGVGVSGGTVEQDVAILEAGLRDASVASFVKA